MKRTLLIVVVILALIGLWAFATYNGLITQNEKINGQWAQVESQYQRRLDLIPNLVSSVQGVLKQEQKIFGDLAEARSRYSGASNQNDKAKAASDIESSLSRLLVIVENYPELKSSETVQTLMVQLEGTENRISVERQRFNDEVRAFNVKVKTIPSSLIAKMLGFGERNYFESSTGADKAPAVSL
jgi:LemA protein